MKNKKAQYVRYEKKHKLAKINKDSSVGNGKKWANCLKRIILPKVLPKNQSNCQDDVNIVNEIMEIKQVNIDLLKGGNERNGTILSIFQCLPKYVFLLVQHCLEKVEYPRPVHWLVFEDV